MDADLVNNSFFQKYERELVDLITMARWYFGTIFVVIAVISCFSGYFSGYSQWFGLATLCFSGLLLEYFWNKLKAMFWLSVKLSSLILNTSFGSLRAIFWSAVGYLRAIFWSAVKLSNTSFGLKRFAVQFVVQLLVFMTGIALYIGCCSIGIVKGISGLLRGILQRIQHDIQHGFPVKQRRPRMCRLPRKSNSRLRRKKPTFKRILFRRRYWNFLWMSLLLFPQSVLANDSKRMRKSTQSASPNDNKRPRRHQRSKVSHDVGNTLSY